MQVAFECSFKFMRDRVSALLPVYNGEIWLLNTLSDIKDNLGYEDELVVVNDGSTDDTLRILETFQADFRLRIISTPRVGLVKALNIGVSECESQWIARFDVDDRYSSSRIYFQRQLIGPGVSAIFSDFSIFGDDGSFLGAIPSAITSTAVPLSLFRSLRTPHPGVLFSKEKALLAGGYRKSDFPAEDLGLWMRMCNFGDLISVPESLLRYTMRSNSVTGLNYKLAKHKSKALLSEWSEAKKVADISLEKFEETVYFYSKHSFPATRIMMHIDEIVYAGRLGFIENRKLFRVVPALFKVLRDFDSVRELKEVNSYKRIREKRRLLGQDNI